MIKSLQLKFKQNQARDKAAAIFKAAAADGNRDLTAAEAAEVDSLQAGVKALDTEIARWEKHEAAEQAAADADLKATEAAEQREGPLARVLPKDLFQTLGQQLQAIARATINPRDPDPRLEEIQRAHAAASGASEALPQDGGFLVQTDFTTELLTAARNASVLYPRCRKITVAGNGLDAPVFDETSRATGSRFGGVQIYRNNEADSVTSKKPKFGKWKMALEDLSGLAYATDNLLEDAPAMQGIFALAFEEEFAWVLDNEILNGDGAGKMLGLLSAPALVSVAKETGQAAATIVFNNISKMWSRMWAPCRANAIWIINQDCEPQLDVMSVPVGTGGVPVYLPAGGLAGSPFATLKGRAVIPMEQCATLGTVGDVALIDPSQFLIIEKGGLRADVSMHVRFIQGEQTFRWKTRNNGQPLWSAAKTPANGTNTLSPFVALATRA